MPRKPVDTVTEHRITLGDYERERLSALIEAKKNLATAQTLQAVILPVAGVVTAGALGFGLYTIACALADLDPTKTVSEAVTKWADNPTGGFNQAIQPDETPYGSRTGEIGPEPPRALTAALNWFLTPLYSSMEAVGITPKEREKK